MDMNDNQILDKLQHYQLDQKHTNNSNQYIIVIDSEDVKELQCPTLEDEQIYNKKSYINKKNEKDYSCQINQNESILQNNSNLQSLLVQENFEEPKTHIIEEKFMDQQQLINFQKNNYCHKNQNTIETYQLDQIKNKLPIHNTNKMKEKVISQVSDKFKMNDNKYQQNNSNKQNNIYKDQILQKKLKNEGIFLQIDSDDDELINFITIDVSDSSQSVEIIDQNNSSKFSVLKMKKLTKNKKEKIKFKEIQSVSRKKYEIIKKELNQQEINKKPQFFNLSKHVDQKIQFYVFCDISIEQRLITGREGSIEQAKRADINQIKRVSKIIEHQNNVIELILSKSSDSLMEFENCSQFLLTLQDEYAKQVFDSLQNLQEKSRLAYQTIQMIQNNRSVYEYILKRKEHAEYAFEQFKVNTLPKHKYYIYNRYLFDLRTGNFSLSDVGYSKDTINLLAINSDIFKQTVSKFGIIEFMKLSQKIAFKINYFSQFIFSMQTMPKNIRYALDFITLDNIQIKLNVEQHLVDLCEEFDKSNKFDCPFIDFVFFAIPQITSEVEENLSQIRQQQNIDINTLLDMDSEEINFYYSYESQQFLKRYYSDIYNRNINIQNLSNQKVDFTNIQM